MLGFRDLDLKITYDSDEDNILNDFYIPVLSRAIQYDRIAGYFTSLSFAISARGLADFIRKGGQMRLVTGVELAPDDIKAMEDGLTNPEKVIADSMMNEFNMMEKIQKDHVKALAWMLAKGTLEIKIGVPTALDGRYRGGANPRYHQKIGVMRDNMGDIVSFAGSINETGSGWSNNIENLTTYCGWVGGQVGYCNDAIGTFNKYWKGEARRTKIFDLPAALKEKILEATPNTEDEAIRGLEGGAARPKLRYYQKDAVSKWLENGRRGIFELATGTGKTITALSCINKVLSNKDPILIVIACPRKYLVIQWLEELQKWGIPARTTVDNPAWKKYIKDRILSLDGGALSKLVIVTTYRTFSSSEFIKAVTSCSSMSFVIADEVHGAGAERHAEGLVESYNYRLGLSATPTRYYDQEGTNALINYFGGIVSTFDTDEAIRDEYLTPYRLYPHIVYMIDKEADRYFSYSKKIAIEKSKERPDLELIKNLKIARAKVLKMASGKIPMLQKILANGTHNHCMIYCADTTQLKQADLLLHEMGIVSHHFTSRESSTNPERILKSFDEGNAQALLAIKCLDEGVDIPSTREAIIMASSRSPIEFIQRRGRILRPYKGKERAIIHDMVVMPRKIPEGKEYTESEKNIVQRELERLQEFLKSAENPEESEMLVLSLKTKYSL